MIFHLAATAKTGQSEGRSWKHCASLARGWQGPKHSDPPLLPSHVGPQEARWETEMLNLELALQCEMPVPQASPSTTRQRELAELPLYEARVFSYLIFFFNLTLVSVITQDLETFTKSSLSIW